MQGITDRLNAALMDLINLAGPLQGKINRHRDSMIRLIAQHKTNINNFLTYAGYKYRVDIAGEGEQRKLRLRHIDFDGYVSGGSQHLSYGERNAFAIVLFMYECLSKNPGLIILDDPISSFDKNKKFAILEMLFRRASGECLKNRTVLMLTHDVEPVIDTLKSVRRLFSNQVTASCLRLSAGVIEELPVNDGDIMTFMQICKSITASADCEEIIKLIFFVATLKSLTNVVMLISFYPIYSIDASPRWIIASLPLRARAIPKWLLRKFSRPCGISGSMWTVLITRDFRLSSAAQMK